MKQVLRHFKNLIHSCGYNLVGKKILIKIKKTLHVSEPNRLGVVRSQQVQVKNRGVPVKALKCGDLLMGLRCTPFCLLIIYACKRIIN
jgi:hypothetical protein